MAIPLSADSNPARELIQFDDRLFDPETGLEFYDLGDRVEGEREDIPVGFEIVIERIVERITVRIVQGEA